MTLTTYECPNCGGDIPLTDLTNIFTCRFCGSDYAVDKEWEKKVEFATESAKKILVKSINDFEHPEIENKISIIDAEKYKKLNEGILLFEKLREYIKIKESANNREINSIENKIGIDYDEILSKRPTPPKPREKPSGPKVGSFLKRLQSSYVVFSLFLWIAVIVDTVNDDGAGTGMVVSSVLLGWLIAILWPGAIADMPPHLAVITLIAFGLTIIVPIIIWIVESAREDRFWKNFSEAEKETERAFKEAAKNFELNLEPSKEHLDKARVEKRKKFQNENFILSQKITLIDTAMPEFIKLRSSANILKHTSKFNNLSAKESINLIDFAVDRMKRINDSSYTFDDACVNFTGKNNDVYLPFDVDDYKYSGVLSVDVSKVIKKAILHVNPDADFH